MASSAVISAGLTIQEEVTAGVAAASSGLTTVTQSAWNKNESLNSATTPPVTAAVVESGTLSSGTKDFDLTALTGLNGATYDMSGKKLNAIFVENPSGSSGSWTIGPGPSNGYALWGGSVAVPVAVGDYQVRKFSDHLPDVDSTHKVIRLTGAAAESYRVILVFG